MPDLVNGLARAVDRASHGLAEASANVGLPKDRAAFRLNQKQQSDLLRSLPDSMTVPERAKMIHSASRPDGHYYVRFPPHGDVFLIPASDRARPRNLEALNKEQRIEVNRLDASYKLKYVPDWAKEKRRKDREQKARKLRRSATQSVEQVPATESERRRILLGLNESQEKRIMVDWFEADRQKRRAEQTLKQSECTIDCIFLIKLVC